MRRNDRREKFSGELLPEVVEEILNRAAHAAVIVRRAQHISVRPLDSFLQRGKAGALVSRVRIEQRQRLMEKIENVHGAAARAQTLSGRIDENASDGVAVQASH